MAAGVTGFAVFRDGWAGSITVTLGAGAVSINPDSHTSAHRVAALINAAAVAVDSSFSYEITAAGLITFRNGSAFSLTFTSDNHTRLGFSSASLTGVSAYVATTVAPGSFYPYEADAMRYTLDVPRAPSRGVALTDRSIIVRTPGTDWKRPAFTFSVLRARLLEALDALQLVDTPAKISIMIGGSPVIHHLGKIRTSTGSRIDGWATVSLEVLV